MKGDMRLHLTHNAFGENHFAEMLLRVRAENLGVRDQYHARAAYG